MKDQIYLIGAGAIGKALAVFLQESGKKVTLLRGSIDDGRTYTEMIRVVTSQGAVHEAEITFDSISNFAELDGTIVLTNKSYGNADLATLLKGRTNNAPLVLLQNGLGVELPFLESGFPEVHRCVLFVTSQVKPDGQVSFKPVATCPIGTVKGTADALNHVVSMLNTDDLPFSATADIQPVIWKKAIVNSVFNSVCPLLDTDNGIFQRNAAAFEIAGRIITECLQIAAKQGVNLTHAEVTESLLTISRLSDGQLISTLQDIQHKRPTEIDTLNFAIVRAAQAHGMEHVVAETKLLGELVRLKSTLNL